MEKKGEPKPRGKRKIKIITRKHHHKTVKQLNNSTMKTRTNYKMPLFFGWYAIGSGSQKRPNNTLKSIDFSSKDLDYLYQK